MLLLKSTKLSRMRQRLDSLQCALLRAAARPQYPENLRQRARADFCWRFGVTSTAHGLRKPQHLALW
jgi:hypothetical protein